MPIAFSVGDKYGFLWHPSLLCGNVVFVGLKVGVTSLISGADVTVCWDFHGVITAEKQQKTPTP